MELPSTDEKTCECAIKWIKKNFPHIQKGFTDIYKGKPLAGYIHKSLIWYDTNDKFLYWGHSPETDDIIVPFPDYDSIDIGEL